MLLFEAIFQERTAIGSHMTKSVPRKEESTLSLTELRLADEILAKSKVYADAARKYQYLDGATRLGTFLAATTLPLVIILWSHAAVALSIVVLTCLAINAVFNPQARSAGLFRTSFDLLLLAERKRTLDFARPQEKHVDDKALSDALARDSFLAALPGIDFPPLIYSRFRVAGYDDGTIESLLSRLPNTSYAEAVAGSAEGKAEEMTQPATTLPSADACIGLSLLASTAVIALGFVTTQNLTASLVVAGTVCGVHTTCWLFVEGLRADRSAVFRFAVFVAGFLLLAEVLQLLSTVMTVH
jgi:hypothetical protein